MKRWPLGLIVDMDGVLYRGERPMPGLEDFFSLIGDHPFVLLTNNSTLSAVDCAEKLGRMGVNVPASAILTVSDATSRYLKSMVPPGGQAFVLGSPALKVGVVLAGLEIVPEGDRADVVVVGLDRTFSYTALSHAVRLVGAGAAFVATSLDPVLLTEEGVVPGAGALIAAVRACVDAAPICVGKPSPGMFRNGNVADRGPRRREPGRRGQPGRGHRRRSSRRRPNGPAALWDHHAQRARRRPAGAARWLRRRARGPTSCSRGYRSFPPFSGSHGRSSEKIPASGRAL